MKQVRSWLKPEIPKLIGRKKVDWSIFKSGTTIPQGFYSDFSVANGNHSLEIGDKVEIQLIIQGKTYKADLQNIKRNDSTSSALQIRYDSNKELKDLLKKNFQTTYEYLKENREEKSERHVEIPEDLVEYIDFYQTETPFVYNVKLINHKNPRQRSYWWVNQGKTFKEEKEGAFLWAPQKSKRGFPVYHHVSLLKAQQGDIVFCYSEKQLKAIGIVEKEAIESIKPSQITSDEWQEKGYLLQVKYYDINPVIQKDEIPEEWRKNEDGPFDINGDIKQGYFFEVTADFSKKLIYKYMDRFPIEVTSVMDFYATGSKNKSINEEPQYYFTNKDVVNHIYSYIKSKGFLYSKEEVINLFLSLKTKPFVILSGISGTGKTKIVQWFAEAVGATEENGQFTLIPVRPDWNDSSDLLGFKDIKGEFKEGPLTTVVKRALDHPDLPYFVLLDEMNLARVEHYFSDILSVMESKRWENGKIISSVLISKETAGKDLRLPNNLYIIGTVNMDETTYPFSKKVLDRANTIEFNRVELGNLAFLEKLEELEPVKVMQETFASKYLHLKDVYQKHKDIVERATAELVNINKGLQAVFAHVGYRVRDEICFYLAYNEEEQLLSYEEAFDYCILQKILPRIAGSDGRVDQLLKDLYLLFTNREYEENRENYDEEIESAKYPKSAAKVVEMLRRYYEDGFTSFWIS